MHFSADSTENGPQSVKDPFLHARIEAGRSRRGSEGREIQSTANTRVCVLMLRPRRSQLPTFHVQRG